MQMSDLISKALNSLNLVEVRGQQNLALLFNSIDTLKQVYEALLHNQEVGEKIDNANANMADNP